MLAHRMPVLVAVWMLGGCGGGGGTPADLSPGVTIRTPSGDTAIIQGQAVEFAADGTGGDPPLTYAWDFEGGAAASPLQAPGPVTFSSSGSFTATVTVTDADGDRATESVEVTVAPDLAPQATLEAPAADVSMWQGDPLVFQGTGSAGNPPLTYAWDFGGAAPPANIAAPGPIAMEVVGTFTVTFSVTDLDLDVASRTVSVEVKVAPLAVTSIAPNTGTISGGTEIQVTGDGFRPGVQAFIGGVPCIDTARIGRTLLSCTTAPAAAAGSVAVTATNPGGSSAILDDGFVNELRGSYQASGQHVPAEAAADERTGILADLDGDSDLDEFQTGSDGTGTLAWLRLNDLSGGSAWFRSAPENLPAEPATASGAPGFAVAAADVHEDGDLDLIFLQDDELVTYVNDGAGLFTRRSTILCGVKDGQGLLRPQPTTARALAVADFDGDGDVDVAVARGAAAESCWNGVAQIIHTGEILLRNDGSGGFTPSYTDFPAVADDSTAIRAADFDRDGDQDVVVVNGSVHQNRLYFNDGFGRFTDVSLSYLGVSAGNGRDAAVGDIEQDGDLDLVIANSGQRNRLYLNDGFGRLTDVTLSARMPNDLDATERAWLVDCDGDGDLDLFTRKAPVAGAPQPMRVYRNDGVGFFSADRAGSVLPPALGESLLDVAWGDVDRDGPPDMVWVQPGSQDRLLVNDGAGGFTRGTMTDVPEANLAESDAVAADLDGDDDLDAVTCGRTPSRPRLLLNDGAGDLLDGTAAGMPDVALDCNDVEAADVDGDGDVDLLFAAALDPGSTPSGASGAGVYLFLNDGTASFTDGTALHLPAGAANRSARPLTIEPIDHDGDGDLDLLVGWQFGGGSDQQLRLWENAGVSTGVFVDATAGAGLETPGCDECSLGLGVPQDVQVGDLDGDGRPDIFVARTGGGGSCGCGAFGNMVLRNEGGGSFSDATATRLPGLASGLRATIFDANGDGSPDVYVSNAADDRLYLNAPGGVFSDATLSNIPRQGETLAAIPVDADEDGRLDLVLVKGNRSRPRLLLGVGSGMFRDYTDLKMPWADDDGRNAIGADFDGDGNADLLYLTSGQLRLYRYRP
jgi:PKD repeat protein